MPEASAQVLRAAQQFGIIGIADCHPGLLENDYVSLIA
jgi:hypothetical protein